MRFRCMTIGYQDRSPSKGSQGPLLLTWLNLNDPWEWDKWFHPALCNGYNYLPMLGLKLIHVMMTSSNRNIFRVTGPFVLGIHDRWFPSQRPVTRGVDVFFDLRLNKRLSKQSRCQWFETPSCSLWRHCNVSKRVQGPVSISEKTSFRKIS